MNLKALLAPLAGLAALPALAGCVTDTNRCLPGYVYAPQYDACMMPGDAAPAPLQTADAAAPDGSDDAGSADDSGLGASCADDSSCTGKASYCLKDPTAAPTDPGVCSIPQCTAADCTSAYSCCDCSGGLIAALQAWPVGVCAPASNKTTLVSFGCNCQ
jgi:hypothetical protein